VRVLVDKDAGTITVSDNGIGLSRQEVVDTIGSIASSGTRRSPRPCRPRAEGGEGSDQASGDNADRPVRRRFLLRLHRRRQGHGDLAPRRPDRRARRALGVRRPRQLHAGDRREAEPRHRRDLHLKDDEKEFLDAWRLRSVIGKFSDHIAMPVEMIKEDLGGDEEGGQGQGPEADKAPEFEQVNKRHRAVDAQQVRPLDDDYKDFYKHISHDFEEPMAWVHNRVEGTNEYTALLYLPKRAPWDLWDRDQKHGVKLYVKRVFIMDEADKLMPHWLRFVKGVVDSDDLPLNVSREILQHNRKIDTIRGANVKRVLGCWSPWPRMSRRSTRRSGTSSARS
jgi:molecular chaperone HtpG